jgi:hypothetical protein
MPGTDKPTLSVEWMAARWYPLQSCWPLERRQLSGGELLLPIQMWLL